jgi:hypothetical protein
LLVLVHPGGGVQVRVQGMAGEMAESMGDVPAVVQESEHPRKFVIDPSFADDYFVVNG